MATLKEQQRLWESLMVREPNREDPPYRPWGPSHPDHPDYGKKPKPEIASWTFPGGTGHPLTEELYWDGLKTILESTETGSDEQNRRLNILWHQFQDQVKTSDGLKIAQANKNKKDIKTPDNFSLEDMPKDFQDRFREMQRQHETEKLLNKERLKIRT